MGAHDGDLGYHRTYTYDTSGNLVEKIKIPHESWGFANCHRVIYNYSDTGYLLEEISSRRAMDSLEWEIVYTDIYTYESIGHRTSLLKNP